MIFSASNFIMDEMSPDGNKEWSFAPLPPNQTAGIKAWVCTTDYHPTQQTLGIGALLYSPAEPSGTPHSGQIKKNLPQEGFYRRTRATLGQPPLLCKTAGPHVAARWSTSTEEDRTRTRMVSSREEHADLPRSRPTPEQRQARMTPCTETCQMP
jgi:hypothetical protein